MIQIFAYVVENGYLCSRFPQLVCMKRIFLYIFVLAIAFPAFAVRHLDTQSGLSNRYSYSIVKDSVGFVWIATRSGIDRFDGKQTRHYLLLDHAGIDNSGRINQVVKADDGAIWAYTNDGSIFLYDRATDAFVDYDDISRWADDVYINSMVVADSRLYVCTNSGLLYRAEAAEQWEHTLDTCNVVVLCALQDTHHWAAGTSQGAYLLDRQSDNALSITKVADVQERVQSFFYNHPERILYMGSFSGNLYAYDCYTQQMQHLASYGAALRRIILSDDVLYIATDGMGLRTYATHANAQTRFVHLDQLSKPIYNQLYDILIDHSYIWLVTHAEGVFLYDDIAPRFETLTPALQDDKTDKTINAVLEDRQGNIWIGTNRGIGRYTPADDTWTYLLQQEHDPAQNNVMTLCEAPDGTIWAAGGSRCMAWAIDPIRCKVKLTLSPSAVRRERTYCVFADSRGNIWMGRQSDGLWMYNPTTGTMRSFAVRYANAIVEYNDSIYVGTSSGLYACAMETMSFTNLTPESLTHNQRFVNMLYVQDGSQWLATEGGLIRYGADGTTEIVDGLLSSSIYALLPDRYQQLWVISDRGVQCLDMPTMSVYSFDEEYELPVAPLKNRLYNRCRDGRLLFGTSSQLITLYPSEIQSQQYPVGLVFTDFMVSYSHYDLKDDNQQPVALDDVSHIRLRYDQNTFSIAFAEINHGQLRKHDIEWMLEGYDSRWISQEADHAYYTRLPAGNYVFHIRLVSRDQHQVLLERQLPIRIDKHPLLSWYCVLLYLCMIGGLLCVVIRFLRHRALNAYYTEKMHFFVNTAHELKSPLTMIRATLTKLADNTELADNDATILALAIKNTNRLYELISELLDFQRMDQQTERKLTLSRQPVTSFVQMTTMPFQPLAEEKNITIQYALPEQDVPIWIDTEKMTKIVANLLSNAIKYTETGGEIQIRVDIADNCWNIAISDNGIGIAKKYQSHIFLPFYRADNAIRSSEGGTGIGLSLVKRLVAAHHGELRLESEEGKGSTFYIRFPLAYNRYQVQYIEENNTQISDEPSAEISLQTTEKPRILVVEDNADLCVLMQQLLQDRYAVQVCNDGKQALEQVDSFTPELIISDIMMPRMSGFELCKQIKNNPQTSHILVVLLTAMDNQRDIKEGYSMGADAYITKPFDIQVLQHTIDNAIQTRHALYEQIWNRMNPVAAQETEEQTAAMNPLDQAFLDKTNEYIMENIMDSDFSITAMCREVAMSRSSFFNKLKALTGKGPNEYVRTIRLNYAYKMLLEHKYSIAEVAYSAGFNDVKYFSTIFKKQYGTNPSKV